MYRGYAVFGHGLNALDCHPRFGLTLHKRPAYNNYCEIDEQSLRESRKIKQKLIYFFFFIILHCSFHIIPNFTRKRKCNRVCFMTH